MKRSSCPDHDVIQALHMAFEQRRIGRHHCCVLRLLHLKREFPEDVDGFGVLAVQYFDSLLAYHDFVHRNGKRGDPEEAVCCFEEVWPGAVGEPVVPVEPVVDN